MRSGFLATVLSLSVWLAAHQAQAQQDHFLGLVIAPETGEDSWDRALYRHWIDADGDDEDTRVEVLIEESVVPAVVVEVNGRRIVESGLWVGAYTGFIATDPAGLEIDHFVPLKEVHLSGGHAWTRDRRQQYANDLDSPATLIAVQSGSNSSKGARDPAEWMPPNRALWCQYLESWIAVKQAWEMTVDPDEVAALITGFRVCDRYRVGDSLEGRH